MARRNALMLRWSVLATILIAGYWTWFYVTHGYVPNGDLINSFPFNISRWWDVLLGLSPAPLIFFWTRGDFNGGKRSWLELFFYFLITFGLIFGLPYGIAVGLFIIVISLLIILVKFVAQHWRVVPNSVKWSWNYMLAKDVEEKSK